MKRFLVVALAVIMSICALAMVGCGEGVKYEDFKEQATALKANDPAYTKGTVWFKYGGEEDFGADIDFEIVDDEVKYDESRVAKYYGSSAVDGIGRYIENVVLYNTYAWDVDEIEEKDEKTESGNVSKVTVVYQASDVLSVTTESYMKTAKGIERTTTVSYKYNSVGYIEEYVKADTYDDSKITVKVEWKAN